MSLSEIRNVVLLFSNPVWSGANTVPASVIRNITALSSQVAYEERISSNITTLTTTNADTLNGRIQGLLYVPDIRGHPACDSLQYDFIPENVTRKSDLPTGYKLIALAPWFSMDCTQAYLTATRFDSIKAFIFYRPLNSSNKPQEADSPVWNLDDDGLWKKVNQYPIFAIPGNDGQKMMTQLSLYSGNLTDVPHGEDITELYGPNPADYVRIWTELEMTNPESMLALWSFFLIVIGSLLFIVVGVSATMHFIQRRRRQSLKRRVETGEVDLEASGIKRLTVPATHVKSFPIFTYNAEPDLMSCPPTPSSTGNPMSSRSVRSSRASRRFHESRSVTSSEIRPLGPGSIRSKRSSLAGSVDTTATNNQPACHICLIKFEHRVCVIRELPCGHIFHPECIDEFLTENSSLCPMCKQCMLPRGWSPKITNGMVRRERALRRLRGRVDLYEASDETEETKFKAWGKRIFTSSTTPTTPSEVAMAPLNQGTQGSISTDRVVSEVIPEATADYVNGSDPPPSDSGNVVQPNGTPQPAPKARPKRPRKRPPRALSLLPTQPEDSELRTVPKAGRHSPSSFARERMRQIAAKNAPFDDPDQRPKWRRVVGHVFPAFS